MKMHVKNKNCVAGSVKETQPQNLTNAIWTSQNKLKLLKVQGEKKEK